MPAKAPPKKKDFNATVLREFARVGRFRVRLLQNGRADGKPAVLDMREYLESEGFTGFTRRGIRLYTRREAAEMAETLKRVLEDGMLPEETNGNG